MLYNIGMKLNLEKAKRFIVPSRKRLKSSLIVGGVIILSASAIAHFYRINTNVEAVFWKGLDNALNVRSVTAEFVESSGQKTESFSTLSFTPDPTVEVVTKTYESGDQTVPVAVTQNIGTPTMDYLQFLKYQTGTKTPNPEDLKQVENIWTASGPTGEDQSNLLYNQYIYTFATNFPVIFANLDSRQRQTVLGNFADVKVDFNQTKVLQVNGRKTYGYLARIDVPNYIRALQAFGKESGYTYFDNLDAERYQDAKPLVFEVIIDVASKQVIGVQTNGVSIRYTTHNTVSKQNKLPENTITTEELQKRQQILQ